MHKFFLEDCDEISGNHICLKNKDVYHIRTVLRMKIGKKVFLNQGTVEYLCQLKSYEDEMAFFEILKKMDMERENSVFVHLVQSYIKNDKMDWVVQKATELGVNKISPVISERSVVKLEETKKIAERKVRFEKIAKEAAKQCKRNRIPEIDEIQKLEIFLEKLELDEKTLFLIPYEDEIKCSLKSVLTGENLTNILNILILIGPEGGFSDNEMNLLREKKVHIVSLGDRILRSETASLAVLAIVDYALSE